MASSIVDNAPIPSVTKSITQESINGFESCGILDRQNIHNDPELAARRLGTTYAIASGPDVHNLRRRIPAQVLRAGGVQPHRHGQPEVPPPSEGRRHGHRHRLGNPAGAGGARHLGNGAIAVPQPERRHHGHRPGQRHRHLTQQNQTILTSQWRLAANRPVRIIADLHTPARPPGQGCSFYPSTHIYPSFLRHYGPAMPAYPRLERYRGELAGAYRLGRLYGPTLLAVTLRGP